LLELFTETLHQIYTTVPYYKGLILYFMLVRLVKAAAQQFPNSTDLYCVARQRLWPGEYNSISTHIPRDSGSGAGGRALQEGIDL
jgi:hypothetical protein